MSQPFNNAWTLHTFATEKVAEVKNKNDPCPARTIMPELDLLLKQVCPYCSGFGHSGAACPTDKKLAQLRGGVREQN